MVFGMVRYAKPPNLKRLMVIVVVRVNFCAAAHLAWLALNPAIAYGIAGQNMRCALKGMLNQISLLCRANNGFPFFSSGISLAAVNALRNRSALPVIFAVMLDIIRPVL